MRRTLVSVVAFALFGGVFLGWRADAFDLTASAGFALENGDVNGDMDRDISDPILVLSHLFLGGPAPVPLALCVSEAPPVENGDVNGDGTLDITDPIYLLDWLFTGGPEPYPACGEGGTGAANPNPRIIPPNAKAFGKSYGEWSAEWIIWAMSTPASVNPLLDLTGELCDVGQSGKVWYLCGRICVSLESGDCDRVVTERDCCVPADTAILFPIANSWCDEIDWEPTDDDLRACAKGGADSVIAMTMEIDGIPVKGLDPATTPYRVVSPVSTYDLPEDNIYRVFDLDVPAQTARFVGDGTYVLLAPLSAGRHVIRSTAAFAGGFELDTTYHLTVGPACGK